MRKETTMRNEVTQSRRGRLFGIWLALLAAAVLLPLLPSTAGAAATTETAQIKSADPDTTQRPGANQYVTVGTSGVMCGRSYKVPYLIHQGPGRGTLDDRACPHGDLLPSNRGRWMTDKRVNKHVGFWAPSLIFNGGKWYLYFTPEIAGGQRCIFVATATTLEGLKSADRKEWACPGNGRWAIDPDVFVDGNRLIVTYRDDFIAGANAENGRKSALAAVQVNRNGDAIWDTHKMLLHSSQVEWDRFGQKQIIENPSMFRAHGKWFVMFSGNHYPSSSYATGIARCSGPLPTSPCTPIANGKNQPYFGEASVNPVYVLPGGRGAGGMSIYSLKPVDGTWRTRGIVWSAWVNGHRKARITTVVLTGNPNAPLRLG